MNLLLIQILIPAFALFALVSAFKKWKRREMSVGMLGLLMVFWVGVVVADVAAEPGAAEVEPVVGEEALAGVGTLVPAVRE